MGDQFEVIRARFHQELGAIADELATEAEHEIEEAMPVDTGFAQAHVKVHVDGAFDLVVEDDAEYVTYLNAGSSPQAEPEFIEHAIERASNTVEARVAVRDVKL